MEEEYYMYEALKEAKKAYKKFEVPVGAVIVKDGKIIARAHNLKESKIDVTQHAEINVIKKASKKLGEWRLNDCDMYVTLEPCSMCAGALVWSRIDKLYIGTMNPKAGACGSVLNIVQEDRFNHSLVVETGILEDECSQILKEFFVKLRKDRKKNRRSKI